MEASIPMQVYYLSQNDVERILDSGETNIAVGEKIV